MNETKKGKSILESPHIHPTDEKNVLNFNFIERRFKNEKAS